MNVSVIASRLALVAGLTLTSAAALAAPGAHGPNGEHLDGPVAASAGNGLPRVEAFSESFEIVGRLEAAGLQLYISRYETSAAVLGAKVEVESNGIKAAAPFQAEGGSYRVSDAKLLEALNKPGSHTLLFTVATGDDADLLDGPMVVAAHDDTHHDAAGWSGRGALLALGGAALSIALVAALRRRNRA
jgi:hypothetical protein